MPSSNRRKMKEDRPTGSSIRYLRCQAEPGMFRDELLVYLNGLDPVEKGKTIRVQLLVDQQEVEGLRGTPRRHQPAEGWLKVTLTSEEGPDDGIAHVILPQPAQPVGESLLVDAAELKLIAGP
jgi:hypothetical protein